MSLDEIKTKAFYNNVVDVWSDTLWYKYSRAEIQKHIDSLNISKNMSILNAGSAGNSYGIVSDNKYHIDIADKKLEGIKNAYVGSIENMPFDDNRFDIIICVGSVLNYCDCLRSISELLRVLSPSGVLLLEYESSWSFEYIKKDVYKKNAEIITLKYIENCHRQWLYSPDYVKKNINACGGKIVGNHGFHLMSGLISNFTDNDKICVGFNCLDHLVKYIPYFNKHFSNIVLKIKK